MTEQGPMPPEVVPWFIAWLVVMAGLFWSWVEAGLRREEKIGYLVRMAPKRWPLSFAWRFCSCESCTVKRKIIETTNKEVERRKLLARYPLPRPDYSCPLPLPFPYVPANPPITPSHLLRPKAMSIMEWHNPQHQKVCRPWPNEVRRQLSEEEKMIIARMHSRSEAEAILLEDMRQTTGVCGGCGLWTCDCPSPSYHSMLHREMNKPYSYTTKTTYTYQKPK